ncbi:MAG: hypothetical protein ACTHJG_04630 [Rhodanobacteraceae bacterium]
MSYTLHYRSSRKEVWRWYWAAWRARLWRVHVLLAATVALAVTCSATPPFQFGLALVSLAVALPTITLLFAAWPQIAFKGKERTLNVGPDGWSTQIGRLTGARAWSEVASVVEGNGTLAITGKNGNAIIIPQRACRGSWPQFVKDVQAWYMAHAI